MLASSELASVMEFGFYCCDAVVDECQLCVVNAVNWSLGLHVVCVTSQGFGLSDGCGGLLPAAAKEAGPEGRRSVMQSPCCWVWQSVRVGC